jgi:hypothetical protein
MGVADLILLRRHPVSPRPHTIAEDIGLHVDADGERMRVQWNRASRPIRNADHAILFIADGAEDSRLELTGRQLDSSSVLYWPESEEATFRLEVYRGSQSSSDSVALALPRDRKRRKKAPPVRAVVEQLRPSPFERSGPEIVETQTLPPPVIAPAATTEPPAEAEPPKGGRFNRMLSKIPFLRRLSRHPGSDRTEPR